MKEKEMKMYKPFINDNRIASAIINSSNSAGFSLFANNSLKSV